MDNLTTRIFGDVKVRVRERSAADYGMFAWPAANTLARFVVDRRHTLRNKEVVEIGCGVGICGIVAALAGARRVTLTDKDDDAILTNTRYNCLVNGLEGSSSAVQVLPLEWTSAAYDPTVEAALHSASILLAADTLFDAPARHACMATISRFLHLDAAPASSAAERDDPSEQRQCWLAYAQRSSNLSLQALFDRWNVNAEFVNSRSSVSSQSQSSHGDDTDDGAVDSDDDQDDQDDRAGSLSIDIFILRAKPSN